ncbi:S-layer homology domain-containing protein [Candidatus Gracilibacteria bacterium]|nr:S-layer homology domain-containing protein [Candidatus Gracilibacteria bacterium]
MKKFLLAFLSLSVFAGVAFAYAAYTDVNQAHNYSKAIDFITEKGIVNGYPDGTYKPYQTLNRAELLKIVVEAVYENEFESFAFENCFSDVPAGEWYTKYVCFAKNNGIVVGYQDGTFKPEQKIIFVEAAKITLKGFGINYSEMSPWYKDLVVKASEKNLIPLSVTYFDDDFSRGQMAEMITRILKYNDGTLNAYLGEKANTRATYEIMEKNTNNRIVFDNPDLCSYNNDLCSSTQACVRNTCIEKSRLYPQNALLSEQNCEYDEVYIDGTCKKAKLNIAYVGNSIKDEQAFNDYVEEVTIGVSAATEFANCPEYIRVHSYFDDLCLPTDEDIGEALFKKAGGELKYYVIYPKESVNSDFAPNCSTFVGKSNLGGFLTMATAPIGSVHEFGHAFGLWDQYCYLPNEKNPNIVNFEEALCRKPETDWFREYCGREDLGQTEENAYQCEGNKNEFDVVGIMGRSGFEDLSDVFWGFTEAEKEYLGEKVNCY